MERIGYEQVPNEIFECMMKVEDCINESSLEFQLLGLIRLRTAQLNACAYCVDMHYKELKHAGESELRLSSLCVWMETDYYSKKEVAALTLTDQLNQNWNEGISDLIFNMLLEHFNKEEISHLALVIAQIRSWNVLMKVFGFTPGNYQVKQA
ncbi:MAG: carboxymuconolactone decarboxylase family protein [Flavobacteriales bacterium]|nr:carboxymuconolactone decarboxylase family protein [Flavobacteriales bacterium]